MIDCLSCAGQVFPQLKNMSAFFCSNIWWFILSITTVLTCVSLAASGDLEGLEIFSLAGADLNKPGYDGQTAVQVVGFRARSCPFSHTFSSIHQNQFSAASQAQAVGKPDVVNFLVQLLSNRSKVHVLLLILAFFFLTDISLLSHSNT